MAQVSFAFANFYAKWRPNSFADALLHEGDPSIPPERLLQAIWHHQRLRRHELTALDGRRIRVLHPGFWNHESGPDFRGAVIQFGEDRPITGDVEIDLQAAGWKGHGHDGNPAFARVILHVVWNYEGDARQALATLAMSGFLDAPLAELSAWFSAEIPKGWPVELRGQCCAPLRELSADETAKLLNQAAYIRLQRKAHEFAARARQRGWAQSFWEGLFRALGYKQNIWPMQRIGELIPELSDSESPVLEWQARLLGVSGLLPGQLTGRRKTNDAYVARLWNLWWRERERFETVTLPKHLWRFSGVRPANHPQRRLALAAHWLGSRGFLARLDQWFECDQKHVSHSLLEVLQSGPDEFWDRHFTVHSSRCAKPRPLIGLSRATDLAINVILPWFWSRAAVGKNQMLRTVAEERYFIWPSAQDNVVLRLAEQRLLGGEARLPRTAAAQQGLLQIVRDFCDHSNAVCAECRFPDFVRQLKSDNPSG